MTSKKEISLKPGENIRYVMPQSISGGKKLTLHMRVKEPAENVEVQFGDILTKRFRAVAPAEMVTLDVTEERLSKIRENVTELTVNCKKRG